jgi:hypothetical protein
MTETAAGQFIDLHAFTQWARGQDLLPNWRRIRKSLPHLVAHDPGERRRLFVTHRWDDREHPDPTGWQLRAIREMGRHYSFEDRRPCFWFDYMSLPQKPRLDEEERRIFKQGLNEIRRTVGDCENITLVSRTGSSNEEDLSATLKRGWIVFELLIARSNMKIPLPLYEAAPSHRIQYGRDQQNSWNAVVKDIATQIPFDSARLIQAWFNQRGITCTDGSDLKKLSKQLHKELTEKRWPKPNFELLFDRDMQLTHDELCCLEIRGSSRLSGCYPNIYLAKFQAANGPPDFPPVWILRLAHRPPMPPLNEWVPCTPDEAARRMISAATMISPMYPGIIFEFDELRRHMRATLTPS